METGAGEALAPTIQILVAERGCWDAESFIYKYTSNRFYQMSPTGVVITHLRILQYQTACISPSAETFSRQDKWLSRISSRCLPLSLNFVITWISEFFYKMQLLF